MLKWFPLLLVIVVVYNLMAFGGLGFGVQDMGVFLANHSVTITMFSGEPWKFSAGDLIVVVSLGLLFVETVKATRTTAIEIVNHALSMLVFVVALIEFIVLKGFATSTFFFIVVMSFFDVVAGFTISIVAAKRDLGTTGGLIGTN